MNALFAHNVAAIQDDTGDVVASWGSRSARVRLHTSWWCLVETTESPTGAHLYPRGMEEVTALYLAQRLKRPGRGPEVDTWHSALVAARPRRREVPRPRPPDRPPLPRRDPESRYGPQSEGEDGNA